MNEHHEEELGDPDDPNEGWEGGHEEVHRDISFHRRKELSRFAERLAGMILAEVELHERSLFGLFLGLFVDGLFE